MEAGRGDRHIKRLQNGGALGSGVAAVAAADVVRRDAALPVRGAREREEALLPRDELPHGDRVAHRVDIGYAGAHPVVHQDGAAAVALDPAASGERRLRPEDVYKRQDYTRAIALEGGNTMGITNSNKVLSADRMDCDGSLRVTLALTAAPDIITNPTDIALVLDRSGSMTGAPLASMKTGAKTFIDIIAEATGGTAAGEIGSGSHIGIVSFADTAVQNTQMITSVDTLKNAVDALTAGGNTNHADAFTKAVELFDPSSANAKVIVMFTDGNTTTGAPPAPVAAAARAQGVIIYLSLIHIYIARTCAATGAALHLVKPMGFAIDDKKLKRALSLIHISAVHDRPLQHGSAHLFYPL